MRPCFFAAGNEETFLPEHVNIHRIERWKQLILLGSISSMLSYQEVRLWKKRLLSRTLGVHESRLDLEPVQCARSLVQDQSPRPVSPKNVETRTGHPRS